MKEVLASYLVLVAITLILIFGIQTSGAPKGDVRVNSDGIVVEDTENTNIIIVVFESEVDNVSTEDGAVTVRKNEIIMTDDFRGRVSFEERDKYDVYMCSRQCFLNNEFRN